MENYRSLIPKVSVVCRCPQGAPEKGPESIRVVAESCTRIAGAELHLQEPDWSRYKSPPAHQHM
ncbi:hypothetical protein F2P79_023854 [Pimephales promelas]|nr:hypothetical protein F2P79_023854 [Pimephales promelas]